MIIWLASYPKSGNTWVRIFLDTLLFSQNRNEVDINFNSIDQFPLRTHFKNLTDNVNDINEFAKNCIAAQDTVNLDNPTGPNIDTIIPINDSIQIQKIKTDTSSENEMNFIPFQKEFESNYNKKRIVFFISNISSFDLIARKED